MFLVFGIHNRGWSIVNSDTARESSNSPRPSDKEKGSLTVRNTMCNLFIKTLTERTVRWNYCLHSPLPSAFRTAELKVLYQSLSNPVRIFCVRVRTGVFGIKCTERQFVVKPTVFKRNGLDHPLSTCASFHAKQSSVHAQRRGEIHTEIVSVTHAGVHTLT